MTTTITSKSTGEVLFRTEATGEKAMDAMLEQTGIEFRSWEHDISRADTSDAGPAIVHAETAYGSTTRLPFAIKCF